MSDKPKIAAMVSGGMDSMVMLSMLLPLYSVTVVHVNHCIRKEADLDENFVKNYCEGIGVPFLSYKFDVPELSRHSGRSIETEARLCRRKVADELKHIYGEVAFAHHADDNAETVLMHIFRGSGIDGLRGMRERENGIYRPLLRLTRRDIQKYAEDNGIPFVTDATNFDDTYTRNFIRLKVLPLIETRYPAVVGALNSLAALATENSDTLDEFMDDGMIIDCGDEVKLNLVALETPLKARYVAKAAKILMPVDVERKQIERVLKLSTAQNGKSVDMVNGLKAFREYDNVVFAFQKTPCLDEIDFFVGQRQLGDVVICVRKTLGCLIKGKTLSNIPDGSVFRYRREGDVFTPFGSKRKLLSDYFIDKKIPKRLRDFVPLLCCGNEVLAIVGMEVSDRCRVKDEQSYVIDFTKIKDNKHSQGDSNED